MYGVICLSVTLRFLSVPVEKNESRWQEVNFKLTQIFFFPRNWNADFLSQLER